MIREALAAIVFFAELVALNIVPIAIVDDQDVFAAAFPALPNSVYVSSHASHSVCSGHAALALASVLADLKPNRWQMA